MKKSTTGITKARKIIIIISAAVIVLGGTVAAKFYFDRQSPTVIATDASGESSVVSVEQMKAALDTDTFYKGITIAGIDVSGKTKEAALTLVKDKLAAQAEPVELKFLVDSKEYKLDKEALEASSDVATAIEEAYAYNRTGTGEDEAKVLLGRYEELLKLQEKPKDFPVASTYGTDNLAKAITDLLSPLESEPMDATASGFDLTTLTFVITESVDGVTLDIDKAIKEAKAAVENKDTATPITVESTIEKPAVTKEFLSGYLGLVSSCTTNTSDKPNRNSNIDLVCKMEDGLVLQPGESFDFNTFIGKRTAEKGFKEAPGIFGGALRMELGGGICQTTGTLYHSVMMADLQVDERKPHSWPSDYVDTGTDATVTWGGANFRFTNNSEYPIAIHSYYKDRHLTMEIYGRPVADNMKIEVIGVVTGRAAPAGPEYVADPTLPVGKSITDRAAHDYISATCYKIYSKDGVEVKRELASSSVYPSIRAKIRVGVLSPDGTILPMDPATGTVTQPTPTAPSDTTPATDTTPSSETLPTTDTQPTTAPTTSPTTAPTTTTTTTTAAPTEPTVPTTTAPVSTPAP